MRIFVVLVFTTTLLACGGGTTVTPPDPGMAGIDLADAPRTVSIPSSGGITGTMTFPAVPVATALRLSASASAPAGVSLAQSGRQTKSLGTLAVFEYVSITPQTTVTLPSFPAFTIAFPASIPTAGKSFFYATVTPHAGGVPTHLDAHGPATVSGQSVTFSAVNSALTLAAGTASTFIVYATYAAAAAPPAPRIYVANQNTSRGIVTLFNGDGSPATPSRVETEAPISAIAVDAAGKLYVTHALDALDDTLTAYNASGSPVAPTIHGLHGPKGVAVDASGKLYIVSNCCGSAASTLTTYDANGVAATPTITADLSGALAVTVDRNGKIYILDACCELGDPSPIRITTYLPNGVRTTPTIDLPHGASFPVGIAVDGSGKIYVASSALGLFGTILSTYSPNGLPTTPTIMGTASTSAVAVDGAGKIYLSSLNSVVTTYRPDGTPTVPTISVGINAPSAIAVH